MNIDAPRMPPLVLRKAPPPRQKPRMPAHPWSRTRARQERLEETALARLASKIPDQATLDAIMGEYSTGVRGRVLARIRQYLKFDPAPGWVCGSCGEPSHAPAVNELIVCPKCGTHGVVPVLPAEVAA